MGITSQSLFHVELLLPWNDEDQAVAENQNAARFPAEEKTLQEVFSWWPAQVDKSNDYLDKMWKHAKNSVSSSATILQDRLAKRLHPAGKAKIIIDNLSLLKDAVRESGTSLETANKLPHIAFRDETGPVPRSFALAYVFLHYADGKFDEQRFAHFLEAVQKNVTLKMTELLKLKSFLNLVLLQQIFLTVDPSDLADPGNDDPQDFVPGAGSIISRLVDSLNAIAGLEWYEYFERVCVTEQILRSDPGGVYAKMDPDCRTIYRAAVEDLAAHSNREETYVARKAVALATHARQSVFSRERARERRTHVGYYLIDAGKDILKRKIGYRTPFWSRVRETILARPEAFYLGGIGILSVATIALLMALLCVSLSHPFVALLFLLPAMEFAVTTIHLVTGRFFPPRRIPRLDFSKGIPGECSTIVAVPALLTSEAQVRQAVKGLEVRFLANRDANLHFALLTDLPDAKKQFDEREKFAELCSRLVGDLDQKYASENKGRLFLFHRHRAYNKAENLWMGWERKRGKLLEFNRYLLHQGDAFAVKTGELSLLQAIRYVITLDFDTQLPPGAGCRLVGTLAHPLNHAVIDSEKNIVTEGYGILQPRVDISVKSASRSRFASLLSGDTGFDIYTHAISDVYQDLFGEGIFTGKGIYEVETFQTVLEHRFPCNQVLSHDLIEGVYARVGLVSDVDVVDDYPSHFSAFSSRKHRWVRGDWQIIFSLLPRVRNSFGELVANPLSLISRWKIVDNLRRSLTEFATILLLVYGWFLKPDEALRWTLTAMAVLLFPVVSQSLLSIVTAGKAAFRRDFWANMGHDFAGDFLRAAVRLAFLCHQSMMDIDAIIRSVVRMKFTRQRLLEWNTAADAEVGDSTQNLVNGYLKYSLLMVVVIAPLVYLLHAKSLWIALPILLLWAAWTWIGNWLNQRRPSSMEQINEIDRDMIRSAALRTWRFFDEFSTASENWLIPDYVQTDPPQIAHRISPTNLGLLLNSQLAAHDLGFLTTQEFIRNTERTLSTLKRMPKWKGHLYNWYNNSTLKPDGPGFISTVDNGNLVSCLWTLKQGCVEMASRPLLHPSLWLGLRDHATLLEEVVAHNCADSELVSAAISITRDVEAIASERIFELEVLRSLEVDALIFVSCASKANADEEVLWWSRKLASRLASLITLLETFAPWLEPQFAAACPLPPRELPRITQQLTLQSLPGVALQIYKRLDLLCTNSPSETDSVKRHLQLALDRSIQMAQETVDHLHKLAAECLSIGDAMDFSLLFDAKKKLFSIGYEDGQPSISKYNYDLLASEARTVVFVAIAKGEAPLASWAHLKRAYGRYRPESVLLSWSGTAFEYLMPCLWIRAYPNTLMERGVLAAIAAQKKFAEENAGIPWGISESVCAKKVEKNLYSYHAFGVPALAMHKDDFTGDAVVAPYASFLALMFDPKAAVRNLHRMKELGWLSAWGFFDAADYTPKRNSGLRDHTAIPNWMAHHQGMSLVAVANVLCGGIMQSRFHADPRVAAVERVLHEKMPRILNYEEDLPDTKDAATASTAKTPGKMRTGLRALSRSLIHSLDGHKP